MSQPKLNASLHKWKGLLSGIMLFTIGYFVVFSWLFLPPLGLFLGWHPDTQLVVLSTIEEQYQELVQPGDRVLSIDDRLVRRGDVTFPSPVKPVYELDLQRGGEIVNVKIHGWESELFRVWELSKAILATIIWFIGFLTAHHARSGQTSTVIVGLSFQLIAAGIVSPGPSQFGAPGGWLVGQVLIFYFPLIMLYLSFIPRYTPWNPGTRILLKSSFVFLTGWALVAAGEQLLLYPETSLGDLIGIRSQTILTILTGISLVAAVAILLVRMSRAPRQSYERQQLAVLSFFLILAVTPLFFFVILPVDQTVVFAPFPFIYSFFLLAPTGYFFVLHRQGYLRLDAMVSQFVTVVILVLAVVMAYATGVYLFGTVFQGDLNNISQGILVLTLFGVAIASQKPVQAYVDLLVYGRNLLEREALQEVRTRLSTNPEPATVSEVVKQVANRLQVRETAVLVKAGEGLIWMAGNTPPFIIASPAEGQNARLRSHAPQDLDGLPEWVELSLPISARGEVLGLLLLSRPINGYFNGGQVRLLQDIADILAFGLLVISLVEAIHSLSQRALYERELQRQQIATEIHNEPLHTLTILIMQLQSEELDTGVEYTAQAVRQVTQDLRRIISGLRPPVLKEAIEWIARQLIRDFDGANDGLTVGYRLEIVSDHQASESTKMAFYYVLTEALNNVVRHALATRVDVEMRYDEKELLLTVMDNGIGPGEATQPLTQLLRKHHLGVSDMHRWASVAGGNLEINENEVGGTSVILRLPATTSDMVGA